jgi:hypothetical protein
MIRLLQRLFGGDPKVIRIIPRDPCRLRLEEFCNSPEMVAQANRCLRDPAFRQILDVLDREHPANIVLPDTSHLETRAIWQARCEGYTMAIANIEAMGTLKKEKINLEATFEPPEQEEQQL